MNKTNKSLEFSNNDFQKNSTDVTNKANYLGTNKSVELSEATGPEVINGPVA